MLVCRYFGNFLTNKTTLDIQEISLKALKKIPNMSTPVMTKKIGVVEAEMQEKYRDL